MKHRKKFALLILLGSIMMTGCKDQPFIIQEETPENFASATESVTARAEKIFAEKPWIYEEVIEDPELNKVLQHPVVNVKSTYAKSINDFINAQLAQLSSKNGERKRSGQSPLSFRYSVFEHERFVSMLTEISSAEGEILEKMSYNIDLWTGVEMKPDSLGEYLGFSNDVQQLMEEGIITSYGDPAKFTEEMRRFAGSSLENFWNLEYKGYTQYYIKDHVLYVIYRVFDHFGSYQQEIPIYPTKGVGNDSLNPVAVALNIPVSSDLGVAYLGKGTQEDSISAALKKGQELLDSAGYQGTPTLLVRMDEKGGTNSEDFYLVIPQDRHTVLRLLSVDSMTKVPTSDLTKRDEFVWDSAYIICVNSPTQPANGHVEAVHRGWRKVFEPVLRPEDGSGAFMDSMIFDIGGQLKSGETSEGYPTLQEQILWMRSQYQSKK